MSPFHILPALVVVIGLYLIATKVPWKWLVGILILGLVGWGIWAFMNREEPAKPITPAATSVPMTPPVVNHPRSGSGVASQAAPLRVWLNPKFAGMHSSADAKYCFEGGTLCVIDRFGVIDRKTIATWRNFPEGWYTVTPLNEKEMGFRWD